MSPPVSRFAGAVALMTMLVAAPARASAPAGRFTATSGVVHDSKTGLNWQQVVPTALYPYASALLHCSGNVEALPGSGWRLPAIKELETLVDDSVATPGPSTDATYFPYTPANYFWSATVDASNASSAWGVSFAGGTASTYDMPLSFNVRCVR